MFLFEASAYELEEKTLVPSKEFRRLKLSTDITNHPSMQH